MTETKPLEIKIESNPSDEQTLNFGLCITGDIQARIAYARLPISEQIRREKEIRKMIESGELKFPPRMDLGK